MPFDGGKFVSNILPNWSGGVVQAGTTLTEAHMKQLMEGCGTWLPEAIQKLRATWAAGYDRKALLQAKVDALVACTARPKTGGMLQAALPSGVSVPFDGGKFVSSILPNWSGDVVQAGTTLTEAHIKQLMEGCGTWLPEAVQKLRAMWRRKIGAGN